MRFSQRKGYKSVSEIIQKEGMSVELRNSLWSVLDILLWSKDDFMSPYANPNFSTYSRALWFSYFKEPTDTLDGNAFNYIRQYFFTCTWHEVYDFLEFTLNSLKNKELDRAVNAILERELAGYRYVSGIFTDTTNPEEIAMLEDALINKEFAGVQAHLQRSLELLSNRKDPDYRNSIKEAICAVESLAREITGDHKATLGDALKVMERSKKLHPALKDAFSKLYGYTSDEAGIRHAMLEEPDISIADAKFILMICTSFINYAKSKIDSI